MKSASIYSTLDYKYWRKVHPRGDQAPRVGRGGVRQALGHCAPPPRGRHLRPGQPGTAQAFKLI